MQRSARNQLKRKSATAETRANANVNVTAKIEIIAHYKTKPIVYKAEVACKDENDKPIPKKVYIGLTARTFKERYTEHKTSFKHEMRNPQHFLQTFGN